MICEVEQAQLWRNRNFMEDPVDPVTNKDVVLERLDVNISRTFDGRLADDRFTNFTTDASGSSELMSVAMSPSCKISKSRFDCNFVERPHRRRKSFIARSNLGAQHQHHPLGRLFKRPASWQPNKD